MTEDAKLVNPAGTLEQETPETDWTKTQFPIELFESRIAIARDDREELSDGGIIIPEKARTRSMTGTVVAVGPGMMRGDGSRIPMAVKVGDRVVFEKFRAMTEVYVEKRLYHVLNVTDLLGRAVGGVRIRGGGLAAMGD